MVIFILGITSTLVILFLIFWRFWFLRSPSREVPEGRLFVSPADGRIIEIIPITEQMDSFTNQERGIDETPNPGYMITIFLSLFDVHYQRAPIDGRVVSLHYVPGRFYPAFSSAARRNERNEILFVSPELGNIKLIQSAGILARRVKCFVKEGDDLKKGQVIGLITLGSRVSFMIPRLDLRVRRGQRVKAGLTVIADY